VNPETNSSSIGRANGVDSLPESVRLRGAVMSFETIPQKILKAGIDRGDADAYAVRHDDGWVTTS
jgi:hypothetical protein